MDLKGVNELGMLFSGVAKCVTECEGWGRGQINREKCGLRLWTVPKSN